LPGGNRLVYQSSRDGPLNIFSHDVDGGGTPQRLLPDDAVQAPRCASLDGSLLAFNRLLPDTGADIWLLSLRDQGGAKLYLRTPFDETGVQFSPDACWIAYESNETGRYEILVRPHPDVGGKWQISVDGGFEPVWSRDGREIFYRRGNQMFAVEVVTRPKFFAGKPRMLFDKPYVTSPTLQFANYDVAPDRTRFLMLRGGAAETAATRIHLVQGWFEELHRRVP
jgi:serine/threonine-protein kinase